MYLTLLALETESEGHFESSTLRKKVSDTPSKYKQSRISALLATYVIKVKLCYKICNKQIVRKPFIG